MTTKDSIFNSTAETVKSGIIAFAIWEAISTIIAFVFYKIIFRTIKWVIYLLIALGIAIKRLFAKNSKETLPQEIKKIWGYIEYGWKKPEIVPEEGNTYYDLLSKIKPQSTIDFIHSNPKMLRAMKNAGIYDDVIKQLYINYTGPAEIEDGSRLDKHEIDYNQPDYEIKNINLSDQHGTRQKHKRIRCPECGTLSHSIKDLGTGYEYRRCRNNHEFLYSYLHQAIYQGASNHKINL